WLKARSGSCLQPTDFLPLPPFISRALPPPQPKVRDLQLAFFLLPTSEKQTAPTISFCPSLAS
ncbi:hypothetical protein QBC45DRAFT_311299, partial [Copromyces sp. CBS 386.78]